MIFIMSIILNPICNWAIQQNENYPHGITLHEIRNQRTGMFWDEWQTNGLTIETEMSDNLYERRYVACKHFNGWYIYGLKGMYFLSLNTLKNMHLCDTFIPLEINTANPSHIWTSCSNWLPSYYTFKHVSWTVKGFPKMKYSN